MIESLGGRSRLYATLIAAFPVALSIGVLLIPILSGDGPTMLDAPSQEPGDPLRWFLGHIHTAASYGLGLLACACIADVLYRKGERRRVVLALPAIAIGAALHAAGLGADGIAPIVLYGRTSLERASHLLPFYEGNDLAVGVILVGSVLFGLGLIALAFGVSRIGLLRGAWKFIVPTAAILFVAFEAVPSGWGLYGVAVSAFLVFIPISLALKRDHVASGK